MTGAKSSKKSFAQMFGRSQLAAIAATIVDFGSLVLFVEMFKVWYVAAAAVAAFLGAITNFFINRHWSFEAAHHKIHHQGFKYALVSGGSLLLNSAGVYLFTDHLHLHYTLSKVITALVIGVFYNFPMHRYFVFR